MLNATKDIRNAGLAAVLALFAVATRPSGGRRQD